MLLDKIRGGSQSWGVKIAFAIIIVVFVFWGVSGLGGNSPSELLSVNGETVTQQEFRMRLDRAERELRERYPNADAEFFKSIGLKRQVMQQIVTTKLVEQEAKRIGLFVSPVELRKVIETYELFQKDGRFDAETYRSILSAQGENPGRFEAQLASGLLISKLWRTLFAGSGMPDPELRMLYMFDSERRDAETVLFSKDEFLSGVAVSEESAKQYYDKHSADFSVPPMAEVDYLTISAAETSRPDLVSDETVKNWYERNADRYRTEERVHARHILIRLDADAGSEAESAAESVLNQARKRLSSGEAFAAVAADLSQDGSAAQGGDLGWFTRDRMVKPFADAAFALKPGELSGPVRTQFGLHLILCEERAEAGITPFDEVKESIRRRIAEDEARGTLQDILEKIQVRVIGGASLEEAGAEQHLQVRNTGSIPASSLASALEIKPENANMLLSVTPGTVLDTPFLTKTGYLIVRLKSRTEQSVKPFAEVKGQIEEQLRESAALKMAFEAAVKARGSFKDNRLPASLKKRVVQTKDVARDGEISGVGVLPAVTRALFAAPVGTWLEKPLETPNGALLLRAVSVSVPSEEDWNAAAPQLREAVQSDKAEQMFGIFLSMLHAQADIRVKNNKALEE
ncbi:MAG: SurA N-terminal domain-containing protein [Desulfovibrionaceae bacterium]|nr:SurA N-terminal domain-containing protein [Desulfovibrionaceae bacterium]